VGKVIGTTNYEARSRRTQEQIIYPQRVNTYYGEPRGGGIERGVRGKGEIGGETAGSPCRRPFDAPGGGIFLRGGRRRGLKAKGWLEGYNLT